MEPNDITMQGYVDLYNPYRVNKREIKRKFPGHHWRSDDYEVKLASVYFIDEDGEYIDFNVTMIDDPVNNIYFRRENNTDILNCMGLFSINVPQKYLKNFIEKNRYNPGYKNGFEYEISIFSYYNKNIVTNDCIEIDYPYKLLFTELEVVH